MLLLRMVLRAGKGRPMAVALLLGMVVLLQFPDASPFAVGRLALFDRYERTFPRQAQSQPVTIVEIDERSLRTVGQWPWPRNKLAALIDAINARHPLAIGLDLYMPEADQTSPAAVAGNLPPGQTALADALSALPSHDQQLARSLHAAPVVLGAAGFDFQTLSTTQGLRTMPLQIAGGDALPYLREYPWVLASLPQLQAAAHGQAVLSTELEGGVVRRVPLALSVNHQPVPSLAMEMLRVATGSPSVGIDVGTHGIESVRVADLTVPTLPGGDIWLPYAQADTSRYVSAADLLAGKVDPARFENKLVLVGLTGFGLSDIRTTPLNEHVPGVEIQAQVIESLVDGQFLQRPVWLTRLETLLLLAGGLFLVVAVPAVKPRIATLMASVMFVLLFGAGFLVYRFGHHLLDAASLFGGLNVVFGSLLSSVFVETDRQRRVAQAALHHEKEAAAKVAGELAAARRIQLGSLPQASQVFPDERRFDIAALLEPAREVGGDLYDFFMLDDRRLFFVVGDVSGKGLPASLFMAVTKALAKSVAMRGGEGIAAMVATVNRELQRENPEMLFVTLLAGILDAETGEVEMVNAGHDAPWRIGAGGALVHPSSEGGPPLCVLDDFPYAAQHFRLAPGEAICVITDGITEAMDADGTLYGAERLATALSHVAAGVPAQGVIDAVREDVRGFVAGAEPADDLTLLVIRRGG